MDYQIKVESVQEQQAAAVVKRVPVAEVGAFIGEAFGLVLAALREQQVEVSGPPFARYQMLGDSFEVTAGFPVANPIKPTERVAAVALPACSVATTVHVGPYSAVNLAYNAIMAWLPKHDLQASGDPWEVYLDDPEVEAPRTIVRVPCRRVA